MSAENPLLNSQQVAKAENNLDFLHPVAAVLRRHHSLLTRLNSEFEQLSPPEQQEYTRIHYGFLADEFVEAGPFTLQPTDLISIWAQALKVFNTTNSFYQRYALAEIVSSSYAVQGAENPAWKYFPRVFLATSSVPEDLITDREGLAHVSTRLQDIGVSLDNIKEYMYGRPDGFAYVRELFIRERDGDKEAKKEA